MTAWDPARYLQFGSERERPFGDLVARIPVAAPRVVVDLGCGPGTATARLVERWPDARVVGVDSSPEMLEMAGRLADPPRLAFALADVRTWEPDGEPDVIVANAVLQWVPGHLDLLARWSALLAPGGAVAIQVPGNFDQPSHTLLREVAASGPWAAALRDRLRADPVASPGRYLSLLLEAGLEADVWETTYLHVLSGPDPVLRWTQGTALRPVLDALEPGDAAAFVEEYRSALAAAYPADAAGRTVLPFRRIFAVGRRPRRT